MALKTASKITVDDVGALASKANSVSGTGRLSSDVVPMYNDGTGAKWGYRIAKTFSIVPSSRGSGYVAGDSIQGLGSDLLVKFKVEAVDITGGVIGLRIDDVYPADYSYTMPTSPQSTTALTGIGTGLQIAFVADHVGPSAGYSFPDYVMGRGVITSVVCTYGGTGYTAGDVLTFTNFTGYGAFTATVATVSSGVITSVTLSDPGYLNISSQIQDWITHLTVTGGTGSGARFSGLFMLQQIPKWKTELDRLRTHLAEYISIKQYDSSRLAVSGPWPISGPSWSNHDQWFWYEDTGSSESVTLTATFVGGSAGPFTRRIVGYHITETWAGNGWGNIPVTPYPITERTFDKYRVTNGWMPQMGTSPYYLAPDWTPSNVGGYGYWDCVYGAGRVWSMIVGGNEPVVLNGVFYIFLPITRGVTTLYHQHGVNGNPGYINTSSTTPDLSDPKSQVELINQTNFPGSFSARSFHLPSSGGDFVCLQWECVNETVNPGEYFITIKIKDVGSDTHDVAQYQGAMIDSNPASPHYGQLVRDPDQSDYSVTIIQKTRVSCIKNPSGGDCILSGAASITWGTPDANGIYPQPTTSGAAAMTKTYSSSVNADGIDSVKNIKKINLTDGTTAGNLPPGLFAVFESAAAEPDEVATYHAGVFLNGWQTNHSLGATFYKYNAWSYSDFPAPFFNVRIVGPGGDWGISTTVDGLWTGITAPISNANPIEVSAMPWNLKRRKATTTPAGWRSFQENPMLIGEGNPDILAASNSYDQTLTVEAQNEPARWAANKWFTYGFTITDSRGLVIIKCIDNGYSGNNEPTWPLEINETVGEAHDPPPTYGRNEWASWQVIKVLKTVPDSTWKASNIYLNGDMVIDDSGNTHTVTTAGTSGATFPTWATGYGSTTTDGTVTWKLTQLLYGIRPASHRIRPYPRYPVYWQIETLARLKPPTTNAEGEKTVWGCGNQWYRSTYINSTGGVVTESGWKEDNLAYGWWIYSVSISRIKFVVKTPAASVAGNMISAGSVDAGSEQNIGASGLTSYDGEVAVTIGCIRNGSFIAFGTWASGQTISVLWPVFTSDALVYQCSERVDVQAAVLNVAVSTNLSATAHPIAAAFCNDTNKLLDLVQ